MKLLPKNMISKKALVLVGLMLQVDYVNDWYRSVFPSNTVRREVTASAEQMLSTSEP